MKEFYFEVLSNASYTSNSCSDFKNKIKLMHPLEGDWEVGLCEISYTKSWYNLRFNSKIAIARAYHPYQAELDLKHSDHVAIEHRVGTLKKGYYEDVETIVKEVNLELLQYNKKDIVKEMPSLFYDEVATKQVYVIPGKNVNDEIILPWFDRSLRELLGFEFYDIEHPMINKQGIIPPQRPPDISMGIRHLLIYCNLIIPQYVGDSTTKLLRSVEVPSITKFGEQVTFIFDRPHYIPLLCNDFDEIEINIKDDMNQLIRFTFGRSRLKLHFRKIG